MGGRHRCVKGKGYTYDGKQTAALCSQEKLVWGKELYIDSTQVNGNADLDSLTPRFAVEARAAIQAHLTALFSEGESQQKPDTATTEVVAVSAEATAPEVVRRRGHSRLCALA